VLVCAQEMWNAPEQRRGGCHLEVLRVDPRREDARSYTVVANLYKVRVQLRFGMLQCIVYCTVQLERVLVDQS
jgi:hypothetical protein